MVKFVETRLSCDVGEHDGSIVYEAAGGDRTRLGVSNCGMRGPGGDASARRWCLLPIGFLTVAGNGEEKQKREQRPDVTSRR